jgi:hypothetical protein
MYNLPGNTNLLTIFILFQGFLVLLVIFLFIDKFFSSRKQRLDAEIIKQEAYKSAALTLEEAKQMSYKTMKEAEEKAAKLISDTELLSSEVQKNFKESLHNFIQKQDKSIAEIVDSFGKEMKTEFDKEKVATIAGYTDVFAQFKHAATEQILQFKDILSKNSVDLEKDLKDKVNIHAQEIYASLDAYEKEQMEKTKDYVFKVLLRVSNEFFGDAVSLSEHEDLVLKLFNEAKLIEKFGR